MKAKIIQDGIYNFHVDNWLTIVSGDDFCQIVVAVICNLLRVC